MREMKVRNSDKSTITIIEEEDINVKPTNSEVLEKCIGLRMPKKLMNEVKKAIAKEKRIGLEEVSDQEVYKKNLDVNLGKDIKHEDKKIKNYEKCKAMGVGGKVLDLYNTYQNDEQYYESIFEVERLKSLYFSTSKTLEILDRDGKLGILSIEGQNNPLGISEDKVENKLNNICPNGEDEKKTVSEAAKIENKKIEDLKKELATIINNNCEEICVEPTVKGLEL